MKQSTHIIKKYSLYFYTKDLNNNGLSLLVMDIDDKEVKGVKIGLRKTTTFSMKRSEFEALIHSQTITFVEIVPKFVWQEYNTMFTTNS